MEPKTALKELQDKPRENRTPIEQCIVDAATFEESEHDGEIELMEQAAKDLAMINSVGGAKILEISHNDKKPQTLHVTLVAATQMEFDISFAGMDYEEVIKDVCNVAPSMMSYDSDLMEAFDDAFRTQPKDLDRINIYQFIKKYNDVLTGIDIDFLEEN